MLHYSPYLFGKKPQVLHLLPILHARQKPLSPFLCFQLSQGIQTMLIPSARYVRQDRSEFFGSTLKTRMLEAWSIPLSEIMCLRFCVFTNLQSVLAAASHHTLLLFLVAKIMPVLSVFQVRWGRNKSFRQCTESPGTLDKHSSFSFSLRGKSQAKSLSCAGLEDRLMGVR